MRVLITGGAGFIGSNLARAALAEGHEIVVLDDLSTGFAANLAGLDVRHHQPARAEPCRSAPWGTCGLCVAAAPSAAAPGAARHSGVAFARQCGHAVDEGRKR